MRALGPILHRLVAILQIVAVVAFAMPLLPTHAHDVESDVVAHVHAPDHAHGSVHDHAVPADGHAHQHGNAEATPAQADHAGDRDAPCCGAACCQACCHGIALAVASAVEPSRWSRPAGTAREPAARAGGVTLEVLPEPPRPFA